MKNPFKWWRERRKDKNDLKRTQSMITMFSHVEKLKKSGMISWDPRTRRVFLAEPIAVTMLALGSAKWRNFLANVNLYQVYMLQQEAWEVYFRQVEIEAVKAARKKYAILPKAEIARIKRAAREGVDLSDIEPPKLSKFEFFILGDSVQDAKKKVVEWVGEFNPDTNECVMAEWNDVKLAVERMQSKETELREEQKKGGKKGTKKNANGTALVKRLNDGPESKS